MGFDNNMSQKIDLFSEYEWIIACQTKMQMAINARRPDEDP